MDALAVEFTNSLVDQTFWGVCWSAAGGEGRKGHAEIPCVMIGLRLAQW